MNRLHERRFSFRGLDPKERSVRRRLSRHAAAARSGQLVLQRGFWLIRGEGGEGAGLSLVLGGHGAEGTGDALPAAGPVPTFAERRDGVVTGGQRITKRRHQRFGEGC